MWGQTVSLRSWLMTVCGSLPVRFWHSLHFVPSGVTAAEGVGRAALQQIQRNRLGPAAPAGWVQMQNSRVQSTRHTQTDRSNSVLSKNELSNALKEPVLQNNNPPLFLFQSLIALLCSNSSRLDKDSLTLRAIYESSSPTSVPVCALHLICNLYE